VEEGEVGGARRRGREEIEGEREEGRREDFLER
jgi:hypothetical protein